MEQHGRHLTDVQLDEFEQLLKERRHDVRRQLGALDDDMADVRDARGDTSADDEHDPEGPTVSSEWSRIAGTQDALDEDLAAIERSLTRIADGGYGFCINCGNRIGIERLRARPEAELCIDCASAAERR